MISLYNNVRSTSESSDTLPTMPMLEYELVPAIKALESFKQSLEFYLEELANRQRFRSITFTDDQQSRSGLENEDSALDSFSEASSLIEPITQQSKSILDSIYIPDYASSSSSDDRKTILSSCTIQNYLKNPNSDCYNDQLNDIDEDQSITDETIAINRQISDEGYRSVRNEQPKLSNENSHHQSGLIFTRSNSYDSNERLNQLSLMKTSLSTSLPTLNNYFHNNENNFQVEFNKRKNDFFLSSTQIFL